MGKSRCIGEQRVAFGYEWEIKKTTGVLTRGAGWENGGDNKGGGESVIAGCKGGGEKAENSRVQKEYYFNFLKWKWQIEERR